MTLEYDNDELELSEELSIDPYSEEPIVPKSRKLHKNHQKNEIEEDFDGFDY